MKSNKLVFVECNVDEKRIEAINANRQAVNDGKLAIVAVISDTLTIAVMSGSEDGKIFRYAAILQGVSGLKVGTIAALPIVETVSSSGKHYKKIKNPNGGKPLSTFGSIPGFIAVGFVPELKDIIGTDTTPVENEAAAFPINYL